MAKEWWKKKLESARKKQNMKKPKKLTKYEDTMKNHTLEAFECTKKRPVDAEKNTLQENIE